MDRVLPQPTPETQHFWDGCKAGELLLQRCTECSKSYFPPRPFCPKCGSPLFSEAVPRPHLLIIRAGALDDPDLARPASTIWASSAPHWACLDPDLPQFPQAAPPS